jgi:hypothetical protein
MSTIPTQEIFVGLLAFKIVLNRFFFLFTAQENKTGRFRPDFQRV